MSESADLVEALERIHRVQKVHPIPTHHDTGADMEVLLHSGYVSLQQLDKVGEVAAEYEYEIQGLRNENRGPTKIVLKPEDDE